MSSETGAKPHIGFIGQGFIGKNYADDFEQRGYQVVRYALEGEHAANKNRIVDCDIVFIAVPTPTNPEGFDLSIVESVIPLTRSGATVIVKSTIMPGSIERLAKKFPDRYLMHSPEFLREARAAYDAANPERNIIGIPEDTEEYKKRADEVFSVLPAAPFSRLTSARAAELVKYAGNNFLFMKVVYANLLFDLSSSLGIPYDEVKEMLAADSRIGPSHLSVLHASGHTDKSGRGAGGHCFIKDFETFRLMYAEQVPSDESGKELLEALKTKNVALLTESGKDLDLLRGVYGDTV
jgi:nucleotide sugar dehydrogenase